jgi:hypothetical protein
MFRLERNSVKIVEGNPLVKMSAYWEDWYVKNSDITQSNALASKVKINLHMLSMLMLY